jgi:RNA polymerase sigma-70 factor (ECF subfamily)
MDTSGTWVTTSTVLERLAGTGGQEAWTDFVERFRGPIVAYAQRRGLSVADAEDAAQEALGAFVAAYRAGRYRRERGRLSGWLYGFVSNKVLRAAQRARDGVASAPDGWSAIADDGGGDPEWEEIWERALFERCLAVARTEFRGSTWRVFEMLVLEERSVGDAVEELGLTRNAVYLAKHRVLARVTALARDCDEVGP